MIAGAVILLAINSSRAANAGRFFRVQSSSESRITRFESDGSITWSNSVLGNAGQIQIAPALPAQEEDWTVAHLFTSTETVMTVTMPIGEPEGMVLIPGGTNEGMDPDFGAYSLTASTFYMDKYTVTKALWDEVIYWSIGHGYSFEENLYGEGAHGLGKGSNHPVVMVSWYDCVKWCNARSEMEMRVPAYYTDAALIHIYRSGSGNMDWESGVLDDIPVFVNPEANGYHVPTSEQWEYAARGGVANRRFPWGDSDEIQHSRANYDSSGMESYDTSPTTGFHPLYFYGYMPFTSPVGSFAANDYGLYDMAGNVWEWCFDWVSYAVGSERISRGGSAAIYASYSRVGAYGSATPVGADYYCGFRTILPTGRSLETRVIRLDGDLAFGEVVAGQSAARTLTIYNGGNKTLTVHSIDYPGGFSGAWNGTIAAFGSQDVAVAFSPEASQNYGGNVTVNSDASGGTSSMICSGTGIWSLPTNMILVQGGTLPSIGNGELNATSFRIGKYEVMKAEWDAVYTWAITNGYGFDNAGSGCRTNHPVQTVNWYDVVKWCNAKSQKEGRMPAYTVDGATYIAGQSNNVVVNAAANGYRLPTTVEWEYAARGGTQSQGYPLSGGSNANIVAWYENNSGGATCVYYNNSGTWPVGQKIANELGIHDMSGNVCEWCFDWHPNFVNSMRVFRGGGWDFSVVYCGVRLCLSGNPDLAGVSIGFRVVLPPG